MSSHPLDLSHLPPTFLLQTRLASSQVNEISNQLLACRCPLANTPAAATLFIGDINTSKRCEFELRGRGLKLSPTASSVTREIRVVKLSWFTESYASSRLLPIEDYVVYTGHLQIARDASSEEERRKSRLERRAADQQLRNEILQRARRDQVRNISTNDRENYERDDIRRIQQAELASASDRQMRGIDELMAISKPKDGRDKRPGTPEYEEAQQVKSIGTPRTLKEMPEWVRQKNKYSCCRPTPLLSPNAAFIAILDTIKLSRLLASDVIGVRAYSTVIAAIQAYPYPLISPAEVSLLPGCDGKSAALFQEFISTPNHSISVVDELLASPSFTTLKLFSSIWGVGPIAAREFYYDRGWRSLDDIVDHGWDSLPRTQQIGIKYFDEFASPVPRDEAASMASIVGSAASKLRPGMQYTIVGGYRRGKKDMHDVDILLSHTDHEQTTGGVVQQVVSALERSGHVTHTLHLGREITSTQTVRDHRQAFDSLEKAMVVFLSPTTHLHRRVDIILAPPISVGAALLGWTGATTFERDIRLWCNKQRGWKFTSEGVFEKSTGRRVTSVDGEWRVGEEMVDAERRVMEGLGLNWLEPGERCTG